MGNWKHLEGKEVIVYASGLTYEGKLIEMNETSILLRAPTGHREIPLEKVVKMEPKNSGGFSDAGGIRSASPLAGIPKKS